MKRISTKGNAEQEVLSTEQGDGLGLLCPCFLLFLILNRAALNRASTFPPSAPENKPKTDWTLKPPFSPDFHGHSISGGRIFPPRLQAAIPAEKLAAVFAPRGCTAQPCHVLLLETGRIRAKFQEQVPMG